MDYPKSLALEFARAVTVEASDTCAWVARKGELSLYTIFRRIFPQVNSQVKNDNNFQSYDHKVFESGWSWRERQAQSERKDFSGRIQQTAAECR